MYKRQVFSVLEPERRRFLTSTSVVNSFCLPLAERITGLPRAEVVAQVDFLIENDLFIERFERKGGEDWYRYHRLLADLLHQRLSRQDLSLIHISPCWALPAARRNRPRKDQGRTCLP